jgi:hypothetical protein
VKHLTVSGGEKASAEVIVAPEQKEEYAKSLKHFSCGNVALETSAVNPTMAIVHCLACRASQRISFFEAHRLLGFATSHQHQGEIYSEPELEKSENHLIGKNYPFIIDEYLANF